MKRWHNELFVSARNRRDRSGAIGRYRKRDALDCGQTACSTCHGEKVLRVKTRAVVVADVRFAEQLTEAGR